MRRQIADMGGDSAAHALMNERHGRQSLEGIDLLDTQAQTRWLRTTLSTSIEDAASTFATSPTRRGFVALILTSATAVLFGGSIASGSASESCTVEYPPRDLKDCPNRRHHPGSSPTANGCGPAGKWYSTYVPEGWGLADFGPRCDVHDICYGTCNRPKQACDSEFLAAVINACEEAYRNVNVPPEVPAMCYAVAFAYASAVALAGGDAYDVAQKQDCECCRPSQSSQVYCGCNDTCYADATTCLSECEVTLGCYTEICGPAVDEVCAP